LFELLGKMGLAEPNAIGRWDFSKAIETGPVLFAEEEQQPASAPSAVILPWKPRTLVR
jgi:hypothetical protein